MHQKGFIDMVKGLLAWLNKVFWVFNEKNKAIVKQKNQSAQKNVNSFLLNTRVKTKKGKVSSSGFGVAE